MLKSIGKILLVTTLLSGAFFSGMMVQKVKDKQLLQEEKEKMTTRLYNECQNRLDYLKMVCRIMIQDCK